MSDERMGLVPLGDAVDVVMTILQRIQRTHKIEPMQPWWEDVNHEDYDAVVKLFVAPHKGAVKMSDLEADPLSFDVALRQAKLCQRCRADKVRIDGQSNIIGMSECPMGKVQPKPTGRALPNGEAEVVFEAEGVDSRYMDIRRTIYGWHWELMVCADSGRRQSRLAELLGKYTVRGGMRMREVDAEDDFDAGTTGGKRRAGA